MLRNYRLVEEAASLLTPALLVYAERVDGNIAAALRLMNGDAGRWRPHLKTAKMPWVVKRLLAHGVRHFKCATTRELAMACQAGAPDVLLAFPLTDAHARRVVEIAHRHPSARISVLVENAAEAARRRGMGIGIFVDVNPGMDRTGLYQDRLDEIVELARGAAGDFRGVHYYDGHITAADLVARETEAHAGYRQLLSIVDALTRAGVPAAEVITSGTPALPCSLSFAPFRGNAFIHRASPGTIVFNDMSSLAQLPDYGFEPAALVVATVVSHPTERRVTCDAGHKSVSADAGLPTCRVLGNEHLEPLKPSEEHLPIAVHAGRMPDAGELLYLLPRHICPTVNLFDEALLVRGGRIVSIEPIAARGHETSTLTSLEL